MTQTQANREQTRLELYAMYVMDIKRIWDKGTLGDLDNLLMHAPDPIPLMQSRDNRRTAETLEWVAGYMDRMSEPGHAAYFRQMASDIRE